MTSTSDAPVLRDLWTTSPEYRQRTIEGGLEPKSNTPEQMLQLAKADAAKIDKIVRTAGIKAE